MRTREKLFKIIEPSEAYNVYDIIMLVAIFVSIIPLAFKGRYLPLETLETITTGIFIIDYFLRWTTADFKLHKGGKSFVIYPITPMAIIDLISILPGVMALNKSLKLLRLIRMVRMARMFRIAKAARYSKSLNMIARVLSRQKEALASVGLIACVYVLISAMIIFNVEPETFGNFFDAIYWATVSLTTVGYGDIYPVSTAGRIITMLSSIFGIAIVAMPAGIITAGLMEEIERR